MNWRDCCPRSTARLQKPWRSHSEAAVLKNQRGALSGPAFSLASIGIPKGLAEGEQPSVTVFGRHAAQNRSLIPISILRMSSTLVTFSCPTPPRYWLYFSASVEFGSRSSRFVTSCSGEL